MKLSNDLTLVLIRGNGAPRTFNLPLPKLKRNIFLLAGIFVLLILSTLVLGLLSLRQHVSVPRLIPIAAPTMSEEDRAKLENVSELTADIAKLQAALEDRKKLAANQNEKTNRPLDLLAPISTVQPNAPVQINRPEIKRVAGSKEVLVEFELQNMKPDQDRIRGYIVVLAKTPNAIHVYPDGALSMNENILLNFNKGETFAISRLRMTTAKFTDITADPGKLAFQIIIFSNTGKVLTSMNVEEKQG